MRQMSFPRALPLVVGVLAAGTLTISGGVASAEVETCYGLAPTVTAPPGAESLRGTEGDDVIIARDVRSVQALGGDDRVCLTGASSVSAGAGDDRVQSHAPAPRHRVLLGSGSDVFDGSEGGDWVYAENFDGEDPYAGEGAGTDNTDVVRTMGGDDRVWSGAEEQTNHDQVDLGDGDDRIMIDPGQGGDAVLVGGSGRDEVMAKPHARPGTSFAFDLAGGTATKDGARFAAIDGFDDVFIAAYRSEVSVRGTDGPNDVFITGRATVHTSAGPDRIRLHGDIVAVDAGEGRDDVEVMGHGDDRDKAVVYDLGRDRFTRGGRTAAFHTESLYVWGTGGTPEPVLVIGSRRRDDVTMDACGGVVRGGGGADQLRTTAGMCEGVQTTLDGGAGRDLLRGSHERDVLIGGGGRDRPYGGAGRDRCRAEVERDCER